MAKALPRIYGEAGHGGRDPGAVKYVKEADVAMKSTKYFCAYLENTYECEVYQDLTANSTHQIAKKANNWGADLMVSFHFNAGGGDGYENFVYSLSNKELGRIFEKHVKSVGQNSRGVKYDKTLNILRLTNMPAILNEVAFVDNKKDIKDWDEDHELKTIAEAMARAAAEYLHLKKKKKSSGLKVLRKVKLKGGLNIRTGPGTSYKRVGGYKKGVTVSLYDFNSTKTWGCTKKGWVCIEDKYVTKV